MLSLKVPPFFEVRIANTEEEKAMLRHQTLFLKPGADGSPRYEIDRAAETWRDQISINSVLEPSSQFTKLPGNDSLSLSAAQRAVENSIETGSPKVSQEDTFYLVHTDSLTRIVAGIRNRLATARMSENRDQEINGVLVQQNRPITYWLPITIEGREVRVELAFCQMALAPMYNDSAWLVVPHNRENPNAIWYVPADQPTLYLEATYAMSVTQDVEERAFTAMKSNADELGISIEGAMHEPNGIGTFPDYKVTLDGLPWVVEITRPLGDILQNRTVSVRSRHEQPSINKAADQASITVRDIDEAIQKAITEKSRRRSQVASNERYCLLLVDTIDMVTPQAIFRSQSSLNAFDSVILMHLAPSTPHRIMTIKGDMLVSRWKSE